MRLTLDAERIDREELATSEEGKLTLEAPSIPRSKYGMLIGQRGSNINELKRQHPTVFIAVPDRSNENAHVRLEGPRDDVMRAFVAMHRSVGLIPPPVQL